MLGTDSRYAGTAERDCQDLDLVIERDVEPALIGRALAGGLHTIAFEDQAMTVRRYREIAEGGPAGDGAGRRPELVPLGSAIDELRMIKDEAEIGLIARACAITAEAFSAMLDRLCPGMTERVYALALERTMVDLGAEAPAVDSIVASGPHGAIPHHVAGNREGSAATTPT